MFALSCRSSEKLHSCTVRVLASGCTPWGAKMVHGCGTVGLQEGRGCTLGVIGRIDGSETAANETDPFVGGSEFIRKLSASINEKYIPYPARMDVFPSPNGSHARPALGPNS